MTYVSIYIFCTKNTGDAIGQEDIVSSNPLDTWATFGGFLWEL